LKNVTSSFEFDSICFSNVEEDQQQLGEIFDIAIKETQFSKVELNFSDIYPDYRPLLKPTILNCNHLTLNIYNEEIDSTVKTLKDLVEWLHYGEITNRHRQLRIHYESDGNGEPIFEFIDNLKNVINFYKLTTLNANF